MYVSANQKAVSLNLHRYNKGQCLLPLVSNARHKVGLYKLCNPADP
jgi:hypothetical protein